MIKDILFKFITVFLFFILVVYLLFLFVLPNVLSSHAFLDAIDDILADKTGIVLTSDKLNVKTFPNLNFIVSADKFNVNSNNNELLRVKNGSLEFDLLRFKPKKINIDYIYLNHKHLQNVINERQHTKKSTLKLNKIPEINIKNIEIWIDKGAVNSVFISIENTKIADEKNRTICTFEAEIMSDLLKNLIHIGRKGFLYIENNKLFAENLEILVGANELIVNGKIIDSYNKTDFEIKGSDIPISDVMSSLLYFLKLKNKSKKFIENFYDYSGKLEINLQVKETGIYGNAIAEKLAGKSVLFNVPIYFDKVPFKFNGQELSGGAYGKLGGDKVYADFSLVKMMSKDREAQGTVRAELTNKSVTTYIPSASLKNEVKASVDWHIKNKNVTVKYNLNIPENSDIYYKNAYLGLTDKDRQIFVETYKSGNKLEIKKYEYFVNTQDGKMPIINGNGLFTKINDNFEPDFVTVRTENDAPVSLAGSFYKCLNGGVFSGNLKYDFHQNKITGSFNIKDSEYKDYKVKEAKVFAADDTVNINAAGKYDNSPFSANLSALNNFNDKIQIYNLYLFLDELKVKQSTKPKNLNENYEEIIKEQTDNFDINLYTVKINKLYYKRVILKDILVNGSIKNNIFNFEVPHILFADGILCAKGMYNFKNRTSDVIFSVQNVNSNKAADVLFNLPNQIQGIANADFYIKTSNGINDKKGHVHFSIKQGFLPQLGSTEFLIKKFVKFKLEDVINIDIKNEKELSSDISGNFELENNEIKNAQITSCQKYISLLVLGNYDINSEYTDLQLFGKYNKHEISKIKIFFVPLPFLVKIFFKPEQTYEKYKSTINKIPNIYAQRKEDIGHFRIKIKGSTNKNNIETEMKNIL